MGLFNFRKKNTNTEELDIPPPPPADMPMPSDGMGQAPMQQPSMDMGDQMPPMQNELPPIERSDLFPQDQSPQQFQSMGDMPGFEDHSLPPETPDAQWDLPPMQNPMPQAPAPMPAMPEHFDDHAVPEMDELDHPAHWESSFETTKPLFVEISQYRKVLKELNSIRKSLKTSDNEVHALIKDIDDEEKTFSDLHANLNEVEKKLGELESSLFSQ